MCRTRVHIFIPFYKLKPSVTRRFHSMHLHKHASCHTLRHFCAVGVFHKCDHLCFLSLRSDLHSTHGSFQRDQLFLFYEFHASLFNICCTTQSKWVQTVFADLLNVLEYVQKPSDLHCTQTSQVCRCRVQLLKIRILVCQLKLLVSFFMLSVHWTVSMLNR